MKRKISVKFILVRFNQNCISTFSQVFNSLPNDKFLDWYKLKAFANNKIYTIEKLKFVLGRVENIVGKGEYTGYQHFLLFLQCIQQDFFLKVFKTGDCVIKGTLLPHYHQFSWSWHWNTFEDIMGKGRRAKKKKAFSYNVFYPFEGNHIALISAIFEL